jgi:thymidylate synthase
MHVIDVRNVCQGLSDGLRHLVDVGRWEDSRAGRVIVAPTPVSTVYHNPVERVLTSHVRDANPFFHLGEALWMLAGQNDARVLDRFVHDYSRRFAEPDGVQHGAYGFRWRQHFDMDGGGEAPVDQLESIATTLRGDPTSRQCVLAMWDPMSDLGRKGLRDIPCNTHAYFRVQPTGCLDITVCCRSNDIIWGCYGANAVHFSILHEYMAAKIRVPVGTYTQVSNNFHAYEDTLSKLLGRASGAQAGSRVDYTHLSKVLWDDRYGQFVSEHVPLVDDMDLFDMEVRDILALSRKGLEDGPRFFNLFLERTARPMLLAHMIWKTDRNTVGARQVAQRIMAADWRRACCEWLERRA